MNRSMLLSRMVAYSLGMVFVTIHFVPKYAAFFNYLEHNIRLYLIWGIVQLVPLAYIAALIECPVRPG